jgi:hypothetical protein
VAYNLAQQQHQRTWLTRRRWSPAGRSSKRDTLRRNDAAKTTAGAHGGASAQVAQDPRRARARTRRRRTFTYHGRRTKNAMEAVCIRRTAGFVVRDVLPRPGSASAGARSQKSQCMDLRLFSDYVIRFPAFSPTERFRKKAKRRSKGPGEKCPNPGCFWVTTVPG